MLNHADYVLLLFAALVVAGLYYFHRLVNSSGRIEWSVKTTAPEPSNAMLLELTRERDEARREAERLRAEAAS